jgi:outer membrane protein W
MMFSTTSKDGRRGLQRTDSKRSVLVAVCTMVLASCASMTPALEEPPFEEFSRGSTLIGVTTGWAHFRGKAKAAGQTGVLEGQTGTDTATLNANYGGAIKLQHLVTDNFALGGIFEVRSFSPDSLQPLNATLRAEDFETYHLALSGRYYFDSFDGARRLRPYLGLDLSYVPEVKLGEVSVDYPSSSGFPSESQEVTGSDYWAIGGVGGVNYLLTDSLIFELGAFYEYAVTTSNATIAFDSLGGAQAELALRPQGLVVFGGLSYSF